MAHNHETEHGAIHEGHHGHDHHHEHAHHAFSLLRASALQRLGGAVLLVIPFWIAVYFVVTT